MEYESNKIKIRKVNEIRMSKQCDMKSDRNFR